MTDKEISVEELTCADCPVPYGKDGWVDVVIPNHIWNAIDNGAGILCFRCITKRLEQAGYNDVPVLVVSGPYKDNAEYWRIQGWEHGHSVATEYYLRELESLRKDAESRCWRPIETAPEEGAWALVYADGAINCAYVQRGITPSDWTNPKNPNVVPELITHWMPLPRMDDAAISAGEGKDENS